MTSKERMPVSLDGGMNQLQILTEGAPDHFFDAPPQNLQAYADAVKECVH